MRVVVATFALLSLALGLRWLQLFIFTDYRAHFRPIIIPIGIVAVGIGLSMLYWSFRPLFRDDRRL